jgi:hypothetical protein
MDGMSLLDVLRGVMLDPAEQAAYNADPGAYLGRYGYDDVDAADLSEAFGLVADTLPPDQAQAAWEAAATPDGGSFGPVTADFDNVGGPAPTGETAPPASATPTTSTRASAGPTPPPARTTGSTPTTWRSTRAAGTRAPRPTSTATSATSTTSTTPPTWTTRSTTGAPAASTRPTTPRRSATGATTTASTTSARSTGSTRSATPARTTPTSARSEPHRPHRPHRRGPGPGPGHGRARTVAAAPGSVPASRVTRRSPREPPARDGVIPDCRGRGNP